MFRPPMSEADSPRECDLVLMWASLGLWEHRGGLSQPGSQRALLAVGAGMGGVERELLLRPGAEPESASWKENEREGQEGTLQAEGEAGAKDAREERERRGLGVHLGTLRS